MPHALIVDDHSGTLSSLAELVERHGFSTSSARSLADARKQLQEQLPDVVLLDLHLPDGEGMTLLDDLDPASSPAIVLITGQASLDSAVDALRRGVSDYLTKPLDFERLQSILSDVAQSRTLKKEIGELKSDLTRRGSFGELVGTDARMREVYDHISRVSPTNATVLIIGESGTGKDVAARTIHSLSRRRRGPFVALNCGAISPTLIESEIFGHERGSFTGADRRHHGVFERAQRGTLFLDEVTEMPIDLQVKLLRVLETGSFTRTGGETPISVDVRFLASTNRKPEEAVKQGLLREDLYYRLKVFQLAMPPLRERTEDVGPLSEHFLEQIAASEGAPKRLTVEALQVLSEYRWPGNVRELKNTIYSAYILAGDDITPDSLPAEVKTPRVADVTVDHALRVHVGMTMAEAERRLIVATLSHFDGSKMKAAKMLGISLKTLYNRLHEYRHAGV
ncbi:MAG TPA: sigma-54 dependent transcriptional regulator [Vicinamibacterales bacterium]|nr:sigma-54 dependent transcriptional regulator [Vicinamibacterales bacterium]